MLAAKPVHSVETSGLMNGHQAERQGGIRNHGRPFTFEVITKLITARLTPAPPRRVTTKNI